MVRSEAATSTSTLPPSGSAPARLVATEVAPLVTPLATFDLRCQGSGPVPVILIGGTGAGPTRWDRFIDDLGQEVLACRFETAPSVDPVPGALTPGGSAHALARLLEVAEFPGPAVLVGHSLGGIVVRRFGDLHPDDLAGALLLDPTTPLALRSVHRELVDDGWDVGATEADADAPADWPEVPLTVLSHDPTLLGLGSEAVEALWTEGQQAYADLTPSGTAAVVAGSGHVIDEDAPNQVIRHLDELVAAAAEPD